jgi:signal transduction histidine kinase
VIQVALVSIAISELITIALTRMLLGEVLEEGMLIALVCSGPLAAWIADRQIRMRQIIARQRDQMSDLNVELNTRNADLDAFARAVAHDLRNPLTTIVGMADILAAESSLAADEHAMTCIQSIQQAGDRASELIDGLLLLHGVQNDSREPTPVDTDTTVAAALETMDSLIVGNGAVVTRGEHFPRVRAHGPWLTQVWVNLIGNAIKYGGSPPAVDLVARDLPGNMVRFEVRDNGTGIPPEDSERIFGEFERGARTDVEGHGLGLAIVNRIIDRLGGETGVERAAGGGAVFWFTAPAA